MSADLTIRMLLGRAAGHEPLQPDEWRRVAARAAWVRETVAKLRAAQRRADAEWERLIAALPEDHDEEVPPPPEQAELDAIFAEIKAVADHDRWPRHLHWSL